MRQELGKLSNVETLDKLLSLDGLNLIDVGCGAGGMSRELVSRGATVLGIEPDPIQAEKNRAAPAEPGLSFVETRATSLPADDASVDGVFFFFSLHHVPVADMDAALAEVVRVLNPDSGFLYIVEPAMTGSHFPAMRPFNDETVVRTEAQAALARASESLLREKATYIYEQHPHYADFEAMVSRVTGQTFNDINRENVETDEVRALFESGRTDEGDYAFVQPLLLNIYNVAG